MEAKLENLPGLAAGLTELPLLLLCLQLLLLGLLCLGFFFILSGLTLGMLCSLAATEDLGDFDVFKVCLRFLVFVGTSFSPTSLGN